MRIKIVRNKHSNVCELRPSDSETRRWLVSVIEFEDWQLTASTDFIPVEQRALATIEKVAQEQGVEVATTGGW